MHRLGGIRYALDPSEGGKVVVKMGPDEFATGPTQDDSMLCPGKPWKALESPRKPWRRQPKTPFLRGSARAVCVAPWWYAGVWRDLFSSGFQDQTRGVVTSRPAPKGRIPTLVFSQFEQISLLE